MYKKKEVIRERFTVSVSKLFRGFNVHDFAQYLSVMSAFKEYSDPSKIIVRPTLTMKIAVKGRYRTIEVACMFEKSHLSPTYQDTS